MSKVKYAVVDNEERWVLTNFYDNEADAIKQWEGDTGETWKESDELYVQGFTEAEIKEISELPEVQPTQSHYK